MENDRLHEQQRSRNVGITWEFFGFIAFQHKCLRLVLLQRHRRLPLSGPSRIWPLLFLKCWASLYREFSW